MFREKPSAQQDVSRECLKCCCVTLCVWAEGIQGLLSLLLSQVTVRSSTGRIWDGSTGNDCFGSTARGKECAH